MSTFGIKILQKGRNKMWSVLIGFSGFLMLVAATYDLLPVGLFILVISLTLISCGIILYAYEAYRDVPEGIKNNHNFFNSLSSRGWLGWLTGMVLTGFYILLYWSLNCFQRRFDLL